LTDGIFSLIHVTTEITLQKHQLLPPLTRLVFGNISENKLPRHLLKVKDMYGFSAMEIHKREERIFGPNR